jgi:glycosyltransferase involved in cell wall biosynthesis
MIVALRMSFEYREAWITHYFHDGGNGPRSGILYVGKLNRHKGLKETCQAYVSLSSFVDEPLYLVGRGTDRDNFQRTGFFLDDHDLLDFKHAVERCKVVLKGELPPGELREYYRTAKVLVLPSLTERFPLRFWRRWLVERSGNTAASSRDSRAGDRSRGLPAIIVPDHSGMISASGYIRKYSPAPHSRSTAR